MKTYLISEKTPLLNRSRGMLSSLRELLSMFGVATKSSSDFCFDGGIVGYESDFDKTVFNNLFNISIATKEGCGILCYDDITYKNLQIAKKELLQNTPSARKAEKIILRDRLDLNEAIEILHPLDILATLPLSDKIVKKFDNFSASCFISDEFDQNEQNIMLGSYKNLAALINLKVINTKYKISLNPVKLFRFDKELALRFAGEILLSAEDSGADMLILNDASCFILFNENLDEIERLMGREITIPMITISQLLLISLGVTDKNKLGISTNKTQISFV